VEPSVTCLRAVHEESETPNLPLAKTAAQAVAGTLPVPDVRVDGLSRIEAGAVASSAKHPSSDRGEKGRMP
jgi:hypothetical protein